jgi:hypothetical protein
MSHVGMDEVSMLNLTVDMQVAGTNTIVPHESAAAMTPTCIYTGVPGRATTKAENESAYRQPRHPHGMFQMTGGPG